MNYDYIVNKIKKQSSIFIQDNNKDNECCLCLDKLNNKFCYECKNCHKSFCFENKLCLGIIEWLKYKTKCPNCIKCFIKIESEYELEMKNRVKENYDIETIRDELTKDILKNLYYINNF